MTASIAGILVHGAADELGGGFRIRRAGQEGFAVGAPEGAEVLEQEREVAGEILSESPHEGGLAGLTRSVDDEVEALLYQPANLGQPALRRQHVVQLGNARSRGVEVLAGHVSRIPEGDPGPGEKPALPGLRVSFGPNIRAWEHL